MIDTRPKRLTALDKIKHTLEHYYDTHDVTFMRGNNRESEWIVRDEGKYIDIGVHAKYGHVLRVRHIEK